VSKVTQSQRSTKTTLETAYTRSLSTACIRCASHVNVGLKCPQAYGTAM